MSAPFTQQQELRLREIAREEIAAYHAERDGSDVPYSPIRTEAGDAKR